MTVERRLTIALVPSALVAGQVPAMVFPVLGRIAAVQHVSAATVTWVLTSAFVTSAVSTPIMGRFADLFGHRRVLIATLAMVLVGSVMSATTTHFAVFIAARVLSGPASALYPLASSAMQHHLSSRQMNRAIAILSSCLGVGGGLALLVAGTLGSGSDYRIIFWFPVAFTALALALVVVGVPRVHDRSHGTVDLLGGLLLATGLVLLLLPLSQAAHWGLASTRSLGCIASGTVLLILFMRVERRVRFPMLSLRLLHQRMVVVTVIAILVGGMSFVPLVVVPILLQVQPALVGHGGPASPLVIALVYLLPGNALGLIGTPIGSRLVQRHGARAAVAAVGLAGLAGAVVVCGLPVTPWALVTGIFLTSVALYIYYGALPLQLIPLVARGDLGVANSLISLGRWVGAALATASTSLILSTSRPPDAPTQSDFRAAFAIGVVVSVAVCLASVLFVRGQRDTGAGDAGAGDRIVPASLTALPPPMGDLTTDVPLIPQNALAAVTERKQEIRD